MHTPHIAHPHQLHNTHKYTYIMRAPCTHTHTRAHLQDVEVGRGGCGTMQEGPSIWRAWPEGVQWSPQAWVAYVRELGQLLVNARELRQLRPCCAAVACVWV
eukprot:1158552-Pelagomonas_calceolata.AAC.3